LEVSFAEETIFWEFERFEAFLSEFDIAFLDTVVMVLSMGFEIRDFAFEDCSLQVLFEYRIFLVGFKKFSLIVFVGLTGELYVNS